MKKILLLVLVFTSLTIYAQKEWYNQSSGITQHLNDVFFIDYKNGWAVGESGKIISTNDGGYNWIEQTSSVNYDLNSVYFVSQTEGWIVGRNNTILHTVNGGLNWQNVGGGSATLTDVFFTDQNTGFIVGEGGVVRTTTNAGASWNDYTSMALLDINACFFIDSNNGFIATNSGRVQKTTDGGVSWTLLTTGVNDNLYGITYENNNLFAVGGYGTIIYSNDMGATWTTQTSNTTEILRDIDFADDYNGWIVGNTGTLLYTNDLGVTWTQESANTTNTLTGISVINNNLVWASGNYGTVLKRDFVEEICIVLVDSTVNKNIIVWKKHPNQGTKYYKVYKLVGANYDSIGTVLYDDMSEFIDYTSTPSQNSARYKISTVDSLGNESYLSYYHETINLQVGQGVPSTTINLSWNHYVDESGNFVPAWYYIYRGTTSNNLALYDSISSAFTTKDFINQTSQHYYVVTVNKIDACIPTSSAKNTNANGGPYTQSVSNLEDDGIYFNSIFKNSYANKIFVYPNPVKNIVNIEFENPNNKELVLTITDVTGKNLRGFQNLAGLSNGKLQFDVSSYDAGVYFIEIKGKQLYRGKFIKE